MILLKLILDSKEYPKDQQLSPADFEEERKSPPLLIFR